MISPQERPKPSEVLKALQEAMKTLLAVAKFEPESPQQHVGFPDTTESPTHDLSQISLEQYGDIDLHALERESPQPVGFPSPNMDSPTPDLGSPKLGLPEPALPNPDR